MDEVDRLQIEQFEQELLAEAASGSQPDSVAPVDVKANRAKFIERLRRCGADQPAVKMRRIMTAMRAYQRKYRVYPGASIGPEGAEGISWRVWLLPHFDDPQLSDLYHQFRLNESWDSPHNLRVAAHTPLVYQMPDKVIEPGKTTLHVFTGAKTVFEKPSSLVSISDGTLNTIAVVWAGAETAAPWTLPGGLSFNPRQSVREQLGYPPIGDYLILTMAATVWRFPPDIDPEVIWLMNQPADGKSRFSPMLGRDRWWIEWASRRAANRVEAEKAMKVMMEDFGRGAPKTRNSISPRKPCRTPFGRRVVLLFLILARETSKIGRFHANRTLTRRKMAIDKSLKVKSGMIRSRNVLTRAERLTKLKDTDRWREGDPVLGLPKVRVQKISLKKKKKVKKQDEAEETKKDEK